MRTLATLTATIATVLVTAAGAGLPAAHADTAARDLTITPGHGAYTGGSKLTLTGALGVPGRRSIIVQRHMGRPGDTWSDVDGTRARTRADGSFQVTAPASAMWALNYRVKSGRLTSPARMTYAKAQEAILSAPARVSVGKAFTLDVDTVGSRYTGYRDLPAPLLEGRGVTLQRRLSDTEWTDVARTSVGADGTASFSTTVPGAGSHWYRARLDDWTRDGDDVGWTVSFPVEVRTDGRSTAHTTAATTVPSASLPVTTARRSGERRHAAVVHGWNRRTRYAFDWEYGQSLTSAPGRGTALRGTWAEGSEATGRATLRNGGLLLSSDGYGSAGAAGPRGDVWATLQGNQYRFGRWEMRGSTTQRGGYELVPAAQASQRCGTAGIVIAETTGPGSAVSFGARSANGRTWGGQTRLDSVPGASSFAVQVTRRHITWFLNGTAVGTLRERAALPKGPMTVRITLVGEGHERMRSAKSTVDWVRAYPLTYGRTPTTKKRLRTGAGIGRC